MSATSAIQPTTKREIALYFVFGVLTTLVNFIAYFICAHALHINFLISNALAWVVAVAFAFVTNKIVVFEARNTNPRNVIIELTLFVTGRLLSFLIEESLLFLGVMVAHFADGIVKISVAVIVVIINYVLTRFIFKEGEHLWNSNAKH